MTVIPFPHSGEPEEEPGGAEPDILVGKVVRKAERQRRPIIPDPLRRENLRSTVRFHAGLRWHQARFHGFRSPLYLVAALAWSIVGVARIALVQTAWWWVAEQTYLRHEAVGANDPRTWMTLHKHARETRLVRGMILLGELAAIALAAACVSTYAAWTWPLIALVAIPALAYVGRPADRPIVKTAIVPPVYEEPTPAIIERGFDSLNIAQINAALKDGGHLQFISDVHRDGPGWGVQLDLPYGVTPSMILARRKQLASGLRRPLSATWPAAVPGEHEGRLDLWIGFSDLSRMPLAPWPLMKSGHADIFGDIAFGTDPRGRPVPAGLFELNWLIGAAPGQGKTGTLRVLNCAAALDMVADIWTHEFSGKGDLEALARISHRYVGGMDDEAIAYGAESMAKLRAELERRSGVFKKIPREQRPDGKLTRELAAKRGLRLRPIVATFDEAQNLFMHPKYGAAAADDAAYVIRLGRAYGIILILATQRPDKDSLPTAISGIVTARFCLAVPDQLSNDMILGTGAYKSGYNATLFRPKTDAGTGWLKAEGAPQIVRTYYLDLNASEKIIARARMMRERAGVLTGYALGEDEDGGPERDVLADVLAAMNTDASLHWETLAERLAARWPDRWADATAAAVSAQCRDLGVPSKQVWASGQNRQGCKRADAEAAHGRPAGGPS